MFVVPLCCMIQLLFSPPNFSCLAVPAFFVHSSPLLFAIDIER
jgi:hypothetical protein